MAFVVLAQGESTDAGHASNMDILPYLQRFRCVVMNITNIEFEEERIVGIEFDCGCYFCKSDGAVHECNVHAEISKR